MKSKIIVIVGPTGVGKTKLSVSLAKKFHAEIINADSMQFYKGLDIGTAKITASEKEGIVHHLFDIKEVTEMYTVYDYQKDARNILDNLISKNKNVVIVGGTGLYIKALLYNYKFEEENVKVNSFENLTNEELYKMLLKENPQTKIHVNNRKRVIRYLNKQNKEETSSELIYDNVYFIGLTTDRNVLYDKINARVDKMFEEGLLDEVKYFYNKKIYSKPLISGIGYKELYEYFNNKITFDEATELIKRNSRRYAKRQYTWFNNQIKVNWFSIDYSNFTNTINEVERFIDSDV